MFINVYSTDSDFYITFYADIEELNIYVSLKVLITLNNFSVTYNIYLDLVLIAFLDY